MKILAVESTAKQGSVAVTEDERTLAYFSTDAGQTHSQWLLPMALDACRCAGITLEDVGLYAVTVGPGSFTGVRIGVSCIKGLAFGKELPCVGVSSLEALAENLAPLDGILCPVMDARRGEVYNALFHMKEGRIVRLCPDRAIPLSELRGELERDYPGQKVRLVGDGAAIAYDALAGLPVALPPAEIMYASAASVARCGYRHYLAGEATTDAALAPVYLRLPQAERERLERMKNQ